MIGFEFHISPVLGWFKPLVAVKSPVSRYLLPLSGSKSPVSAITPFDSAWELRPTASLCIIYLPFPATKVQIRRWVKPPVSPQLWHQHLRSRSWESAHRRGQQKARPEQSPSRSKPRRRGSGAALVSWDHQSWSELSKSDKSNSNDDIWYIKMNIVMMKIDDDINMFIL